MRWLLPLALIASGQAYAEIDARLWLEQMSAAMKNLDYDGTFVYQHDDQLEAMRILHRQDEGGERERLLSLTGSAREVLRDDRVVTCIMADSKSVMVGRRGSPHQPFPEVPDDLGGLADVYTIADMGEDRIAGYLARIIAITPKDRLRYGYRFWIDTESRMLLKFDLTDVDGTAIEKLMFTNLGIGLDIPESAFKPSLTGEGYSWERQAAAQEDAPAGSEPGWHAVQLPAGFRMTAFHHRQMREDGEPAQHLVYSDGLATVSVYVERLSGSADSFTGQSSMGAMNAYGAVIDGHQVTVVGEVPPSTVRMIAASVARRS